MLRDFVDFFRRFFSFAWFAPLRKEERFDPPEFATLDEEYNDPLKSKTIEISLTNSSSLDLPAASLRKKKKQVPLQTTEAVIGFFTSDVTLRQTSPNPTDENRSDVPLANTLPDIKGPMDEDQIIGTQIDANFAVPLPSAHEFFLTRESFAQHLLAKAKEIKPEAVLHYDANEFSIKSRSSDQQVMYLHNAYLEYSRCTAEERPYVLKKWLRHLLFLKQIPEDFEDVVPDLMPALRTRGYFELIQLKFRSQNRDMPMFPYQDVGEHFGLTVAYDMNDSIIMISQKHLDDWNLTFYEAMEIAMRNLYEKGCVLTALTMEDKFKVYIPTVGDSFDATRLMLVDQLRNLDVIGETIAMILSPDSMMITGSEDRLGLTFFLSQAVESRDKPHAIPPMLLRLVGDEWKVWLPPASSDFYFPFRQFQVTLFGSDYSEQQSLLSSIYENEGRDVFIANYFVAQREATQQIFTYTVWTNGIQDILLPKAEYIAFMENESSAPVVIPWKVAEEVVGYLMSPRPVYPLRIHVGVYPTNREIEEMQRLCGNANPFE